MKIKELIEKILVILSGSFFFGAIFSFIGAFGGFIIGSIYDVDPIRVFILGSALGSTFFGLVGGAGLSWYLIDL